MDSEGKKTGGRQKGTPNKDTKDIRALFKNLVEGNLNKLQGDIDGLKGVERVKYTLEMAKFCIPTLKSVDYKGDVVIEAKRRISFVDKTKEPIKPIIKIIQNEEINFIPPSNEPIF
jgi:hypothetical protein